MDCGTAGGSHWKTFMFVMPCRTRVYALALLMLMLVGGCTRMPRTGVTHLKPANSTELRGHLLAHKADFELFRLRGPFAVDMQQDLELRLSATERIAADLYLSSPAEKTALVVFLHGYGNAKEDHAYQALHVASWGMHSLALQLPNNGPWVGNGKTLARIVEVIYRQPELLDKRIDVDKIILVGHSFGASAVTIAMAEGARVAGGILLDPASVGRDLPEYLRQVNKPVMLLGADERISQTRNRDYFYSFIRGGIAEISIRDAVHEDAQFRDEEPQQRSAGAPSATEALQITFVSAITSAAFSLGATGKFDYAWSSFGDAIKDGRLFNAKKK